MLPSFSSMFRPAVPVTPPAAGPAPFVDHYAGSPGHSNLSGPGGAGSGYQNGYQSTGDTPWNGASSAGQLIAPGPAQQPSEQAARDLGSAAAPGSDMDRVKAMLRAKVTPHLSNIDSSNPVAPPNGLNKDTLPDLGHLIFDTDMKMDDEKSEELVKDLDMLVGQSMDSTTADFNTVSSSLTNGFGSVLDCNSSMNAFQIDANGVMTSVDDGQGMDRRTRPMIRSEFPELDRTQEEEILRRIFSCENLIIPATSLQSSVTVTNTNQKPSASRSRGRKQQSRDLTLANQHTAHMHRQPYRHPTPGDAVYYPGNQFPPHGSPRFHGNSAMIPPSAYDNPQMWPTNLPPSNRFPGNEFPGPRLPSNGLTNGAPPGMYPRFPGNGGHLASNYPRGYGPVRHYSPRHSPPGHQYPNTLPTQPCHQFPPTPPYSTGTPTHPYPEPMFSPPLDAKTEDGIPVLDDIFTSYLTDRIQQNPAVPTSQQSPLDMLQHLSQDPTSSAGSNRGPLTPGGVNGIPQGLNGHGPMPGPDDTLGMKVQVTDKQPDGTNEVTLSLRDDCKSVSDENFDLLRRLKDNLQEVPICQCVARNGETMLDQSPYYTQLGSAPSVAAMRTIMEQRFGESGDAIRIEKISYTGKEGKTAQGCPIAKWIIRRSCSEEKLLVLLKERRGHYCDWRVIVVCLVAWEGVNVERADDLYKYLSETLPVHGLATERRCATNEQKTCACQGFDDAVSGASFSFGCSWSMFYNGCKFARSRSPKKFKLKTDDEESVLEEKVHQLADEMAPLYKRLAPSGYENQCKFDDLAHDCRLGTLPGRPFSGMTACVDFCAHSHKDLHNMNNGSTVVVSLTKHRGLSRPDDEQLHVLPLYTLDPGGEFNNPTHYQQKIKQGALEVLTSFPTMTRIRAQPRTPRRKNARKTKAEKEATPKKVSDLRKSSDFDSSPDRLMSDSSDRESVIRKLDLDSSPSTSSVLEAANADDLDRRSVVSIKQEADDTVASGNSDCKAAKHPSNSKTPSLHRSISLDNPVVLRRANNASPTSQISKVQRSKSVSPPKALCDDKNRPVSNPSLLEHSTKITGIKSSEKSNTALKSMNSNNNYSNTNNNNRNTENKAPDISLVKRESNTVENRISCEKNEVKKEGTESRSKCAKDSVDGASSVRSDACLRGSPTDSNISTDCQSNATGSDFVGNDSTNSSPVKKYNQTDSANTKSSEVPNCDGEDGPSRGKSNVENSEDSNSHDDDKSLKSDRTESGASSHTTKSTSKPNDNQNEKETSNSASDNKTSDDSTDATKTTDDSASTQQSCHDNPAKSSDEPETTTEPSAPTSTANATNSDSATPMDSDVKTEPESVVKTEASADLDSILDDDLSSIEPTLGPWTEDIQQIANMESSQLLNGPESSHLMNGPMGPHGGPEHYGMGMDVRQPHPGHPGHYHPAMSNGGMGPMHNGHGMMPGQSMMMEQQQMYAQQRFRPPYHTQHSHPPPHPAHHAPHDYNTYMAAQHNGVVHYGPNGQPMIYHGPPPAYHNPSHFNGGPRWLCHDQEQRYHLNDTGQFRMDQHQHCGPGGLPPKMQERPQPGDEQHVPKSEPGKDAASSYFDTLQQVIDDVVQGHANSDDDDLEPPASTTDTSYATQESYLDNLQVILDDVHEQVKRSLNTVDKYPANSVHNFTPQDRPVSSAGTSNGTAPPASASSPVATTMPNQAPSPMSTSQCQPRMPRFIPSPRHRMAQQTQYMRESLPPYQQQPMMSHQHPAYCGPPRGYGMRMRQRSPFMQEGMMRMQGQRSPYMMHNGPDMNGMGYPPGHPGHPMMRHMMGNGMHMGMQRMPMGRGMLGRSLSMPHGMHPGGMMVQRPMRPGTPTGMLMRPGTPQSPHGSAPGTPRMCAPPNSPLAMPQRSPIPGMCVSPRSHSPFSARAGMCHELLSPNDKPDLANLPFTMPKLPHMSPLDHSPMPIKPEAGGDISAQSAHIRPHVNPKSESTDPFSCETIKVSNPFEDDYKPEVTTLPVPEPQPVGLMATPGPPEPNTTPTAPGPEPTTPDLMPDQKRKQGTVMPPDEVGKDREFLCMNEESFYDSNIGGVAIALGHGAVLFEVAKRELHSTTAIKHPDRSKPTRISLVLYQHKNLNFAQHGWSEWEQKMEQRRLAKERAKMEPAPPADEEFTAPTYRYMWDTNTSMAPASGSDTVTVSKTTAWQPTDVKEEPSSECTSVTGPYKSWS